MADDSIKQAEGILDDLEVPEVPAAEIAKESKSKTAKKTVKKKAKTKKTSKKKAAKKKKATKKKAAKKKKATKKKAAKKKSANKKKASPKTGSAKGAVAATATGAAMAADSGEDVKGVQLFSEDDDIFKDDESLKEAASAEDLGAESLDNPSGSDSILEEAMSTDSTVTASGSEESADSFGAYSDSEKQENQKKGFLSSFKSIFSKKEEEESQQDSTAGSFTPVYEYGEDNRLSDEGSGVSPMEEEAPAEEDAPQESASSDEKDDLMSDAPDFDKSMAELSGDEGESSGEAGAIAQNDEPIDTSAISEELGIEEPKDIYIDESFIEENTEELNKNLAELDEQIAEIDKKLDEIQNEI